MNTPSRRIGTDLAELMFWVFLGLLLFSFLGLIVAEYGLNVPVFTDSSSLFAGTPSARRALILIQALSSIGFSLVPCLIWAARRNGIGRQLALDRALTGRQITNGVLLMIVAIPALNAMTYFFESLHYPSWLQWWIELGDQNDGLLEEFLDMRGYGDLAVNLFVMAVLPAIGEEILFRGAIQPTLIRCMNAHVAIWISALLFGLVHQDLINLVPLTLLGGMLGYLRLWSGSLWLPILAHYTNNSLLLILTFILQRNGITEDAVNLVGTPGLGGFMAVISLALVAFNLWLLRNSPRAV